LNHRTHLRAGFLRPGTLRDKLRVSIVGLMLISLLGSIFTFAVSSMWTQNQLLRRQAEASSQQLAQALQARVHELETAAHLLANDPEVMHALTAGDESTLEVLNRRAVVIRDRFDLGLVQIYNAGGLARTNLLLADLYRETTLLDYVPMDTTAARVVANHGLLLRSDGVGNGSGTVIVGLDLKSEIIRLLARHRLSAEMGLRFESVAQPGAPVYVMQIATSENFPFNAPPGRSAGIYKHQSTLLLGETPVDLLLIHSTADLQHVASTGMIVILVTTAITTVLLMVLSTTVLHGLVQPIQQIASTATAVAKGDLTQRIIIPHRRSWLNIGQDDEIALLTEAFNAMVSDLEDLYAHLETRVAARTHELSVAAELARNISASTDVFRIMQMATQLLRQKLEFLRVGFFVVDESMQHATLREISGEIGECDKGYVVPLSNDRFIGAAALMHTACLVTDVAHEQRLFHEWLPQAQAGLAVPMLYGQQVLGVLEIQSLRPEAFSPEMIRLLNTLADQIAMGMHNAQRYAEEQKRRRVAELLELTGRVLAGSLDIESLPGRAMASLSSVVKHERSALWIQEDDQLKPLAQYGFSDQYPLPAKTLSTQGDLYQHVCAQRQPLVIADVTTETQWQQRPWLRGDRAWIGAPIIARGQVIGLLGLGRSTPGSFEADDATWVQSFAAQLGLALENANLYTQLVRQNDRLTRAQKRRASGSGCDKPETVRELQVGAQL